MCTILFAYRQVPGYAFIAAANRDEFYERPTRGLHWWDDHPDLLAGRDLREGGTWFGITRAGRFATLTNYREPGRHLVDAPSRGHLVRDFLTGDESLDHFAESLSLNGTRYNGFNLLFGHGADIRYYANRGSDGSPVAAQHKPRALKPGFHGLSNHLLDSPWPKVRHGITCLQEWLDKSADSLELSVRDQSDIIAASPFQNPVKNRPTLPSDQAFEWLSDQAVFPDEALPDTGVGLERERMLSALYIKSPTYGTRASWLLAIRNDGRVEVVEKSYVPDVRSAHFHFDTSPSDSVHASVTEKSP